MAEGTAGERGSLFIFDSITQTETEINAYRISSAQDFMSSRLCSLEYTVLRPPT